MDPFRQGTALMLSSVRAVAVEYRAQGTGTPVPCRILLYSEPDETGRPSITAGKMVATGHLAPDAGFAALRRSDTFTVLATGKVFRVEQLGKAELGWDWRAYLQDGA